MKQILLLVFCGMTVCGSAYAAALSAEEECRQRNAASCEANGLKFFMTEQECPRGVKVLRKLGHEDCSKFAAASAVPAAAASDPLPQTEPAKELAAAADNTDSTNDLWGNPYFMLALVGLLQGMVTRISVGSVLIVALVMPLLGTWSIVSGTPLPGGMLANLPYIAMELLGTFLFSIAGWGAGLLIRKIAYRVLLPQR